MDRGQVYLVSLQFSTSCNWSLQHYPPQDMVFYQVRISPSRWLHMTTVIPMNIIDSRVNSNVYLWTMNWEWHGKIAWSSVFGKCLCYNSGVLFTFDQSCWAYIHNRLQWSLFSLGSTDLEIFKGDFYFWKLRTKQNKRGLRI